MEFNRQLSRLVSGLAALTVILTACQGSPSGSTVPSGMSGIAAPQAGILPADRGDRGEIVDSCGNRIHIILAGIIKCRFHEQGYGLGTFQIHNHTNGLISISPTSGNKNTHFIITGLLIGSGYFTVTDTHGHVRPVTVKVTL